MKKTYLVDRARAPSLSAQDLASLGEKHQVARSISRNRPTTKTRGGRDSHRGGAGEEEEEGGRGRGETVRSAKLLRRREICSCRGGTSEITLTREVDKAQSFVHDKTRSPWNRRDRWWFLNGADCHVHWSPGMYAHGGLR